MSESTSPGQKPQIEISADEDWKSRVKAEDAKLDATLHQEAGDSAPKRTEPTDDDDDEGEIPDANFLTLLQLLSTQAILALGMVPGPDGKQHVELPVARHFIDLLAVLESKCEGNLSNQESRFLEQTLHELRMGFLEVSRKS